MRPLKLHTKTTLVASAITLAVLGVVLALVSVRVADRVREEQKALSTAQVAALAAQISQMPAPRDPEELARMATYAHGARPDAVTVRVWERVGGVFKELVASAGSEPAEEIPEETKAALRSGMTSKNVTPLVDANNSRYRVFAPFTEGGRVSGAVEIVERLDSATTIAWQYGRSAIWLGLAAVALITLGVSFLFRQTVYRPIERLLDAMARARAGDLDARAPDLAPNEIGILAREYNSLITRLRAMTAERERQKDLLQVRVNEATAELADRNIQLEEANLELWRTARRLTELERLAAAGQTAAQFAHEVGTPLNLISGHVQLLLLAGARGDAPGGRERLETISAQIERIERIVRRMLDRTRPETGEMEPLDMNALLRRTFDATTPTLDAKGVRLEASLAEDLPLLRGDADRLQQVFINLINNALDAMPEGGGLAVTTFVEDGDGASADAATRSADNGAGETDEMKAPHVVVDFADTGYGMTDEVRARIFDPLYTTKARGRGTGLGLVVVSQVVGDHGGRIEVESGRGRGARFRLIFPAGRDADADVEGGVGEREIVAGETSRVGS
ncbi:MAG: two-component system, NtrC family, sensor kinase [Acidobacteriota bacterium]|jgi:signal transduction histidine kinase|nr:two-component system, NtrC family, sensor kinase [Acidobacteriota bacterium]